MSSDFFEYFPASPKDQRWGINATACGRASVAAGFPYPPGKHPANHHFQWEQGRILQDYQVLYISGGRGRFETSAERPIPIETGTAFLLFPGVWHRYKPDPGTGWIESWIEFDGAMAVALQDNKTIHPGHPVHRLGSSHEILALFEETSHLAHLKPPGFSIRIGLIALQILTLVVSRKGRASRTAPRHIDHIISEAQSLMARQPDGTLRPESVARRLGVGYSYFRRMFKRQTGFSPKQYQAEIRLRSAKELLRNSGLTLEEIANRLGYYSPYHFSLDFSKRTGHPPSRWRNSIV